MTGFQEMQEIKISKSLKKITLLFALLFSSDAFAAGGGEGGDFDAGDMILGHIADSHEWHIADGLVVYLPVILYSQELGFDFFLSSKFHNDSHAYGGYILKEGVISHENAQIAVYDFSITKNVAQIFLCCLLMLIVFTSIANYYKKSPNRPPKGLASFFEPIIIFIRDDIARPNIGPKYGRYMPYLLTLFFFIWFLNVIG